MTTEEKMTPEEAIEILQLIRLGKHITNDEALEMAIKSLSQEPCTDAVSREAVLEMAYDMSEIDGEHFTEPCMVVDVEDIQKLPSVNPQPCDDAISREAVIEWLENATYEDISDAVGTELSFLPSVTQKSGKWIDYSDEGYVECPFCEHATTCEDNIDELHYCFYCGAKMESGDKE